MIILIKPRTTIKEEADVKDLLLKMTEVKDAISADNESSVITQLQKLRTATVDTLNEIKKSFSDFAKEMSQNNVNALIEAVQKVMEDFNAKINDQLGESFKQLNSSVENLVKWQNNYKTHVENLTEQIQTAVSGITSSQESLKQISTNMESIPKSTEALKELITSIQGQIDNLNGQLEAFSQMKEKALAVLNGKMVSTTTVMTQLMRLQQITCGHFTADDGSTQEIPNNRIDELTDVLEEIEGKVVIWGHWQKDINQIIKAIVKEYGEKSVVDYYGLTPKNERQKNIDKFQTDPNCRFFVGTPATGGYGITLTAASNMIYYSNGYNLEFRTQSEARIDRIGQKYPMTYIDIICEDTVDERIVKALKKKINIATKIMGEELKAWI